MRSVATHRRNGVLILAAALTAAGFTACSSESGNSGGGGGGIGSTLRVVHGATPNQFDPCGTPNGSELAYMTAIYAPLIRTNPATGKLSPGIATSWTTSKNGLTLVLTLRSGLTFQDDTPVDADTVTESLNQCLKLGNQDVPGLDSISAEGKDTVVFHLTSPSSGLIDLLGARLGLVASPAARTKSGDNYGASPVGAGPYQLTDFVPGSSITLTKWDGYKDAGVPAAKVKEIRSSIITDPSAQVAALTGGDADFGYSLDPSVVDSLKSSDIKVTHSIGVSVADLNVDRSHGPMANPKVRQAVSYAIDRAALADNVTNGLTNVPSLQPYPPGHPYHFNDLDKAYTYDPDKAKQLLAEAGYPDGLKLRGVSLDGQSFVNAGLIISDQLAKVGIHVTFTAKALPDATKSFYQDHDYDLFSTGMNSGPDWITIYRRLLSTDSAGNAGNVPVPGGDKALAAVNAATTQEQVRQALHEATVVYQQQLPIIPLYFGPFVTAWGNQVSGGPDAFAINGEADFTALGLDR